MQVFSRPCHFFDPVIECFYSMKQYDLLFWLPGSFSESEAPSLVENIKQLLAEIGAEKAQLEILGRQKLAYPIKANHFGYAVNSTFVLPPEKVKTLKEKLGLEPVLLRFVLTHHQAKTYPHRRPVGRVAPPEVKPAAGQVDLKEIDKKIDEILQQDNIVV